MLQSTLNYFSTGTSVLEGVTKVSNYISPTAQKTDRVVPLILLFSLAAYSYTPKGTLIGVVNHEIRYYYPSSSQSSERTNDLVSRDQLKGLQTSFYTGLELYCPPKSEAFRFVLDCALRGLERLGDEYRYNRRNGDAAYTTLNGYHSSLKYSLTKISETTTIDTEKKKDKKRERSGSFDLILSGKKEDQICAKVDTTKTTPKKRERSDSNKESDNLKYSHKIEQKEGVDCRQFLSTDDIDEMIRLLKKVDACSQQGKEVEWIAFKQSARRKFFESLTSYIQGVNIQVIEKAGWI